MNQFTCPPELKFIKSHQNKNKTYVELLLPARLNVDDDKLASNLQYPLQVSSIQAPIIKNNVVLIHCSKGTITSYYCQKIPKLGSFPKMREYKIKKRLEK